MKRMLSVIRFNVCSILVQFDQAPTAKYTVNVLKFQTITASQKGLANRPDPDQTASEEAV